MTKSEWNKSFKGTRVTMKTWKPVDVILNGTIVRSNSNHSQVLVKWDETDNEIWYGRLGIELIK